MTVLILPRHHLNRLPPRSGKHQFPHGGVVPRTEQSMISVMEDVPGADNQTLVPAKQPMPDASGIRSTMIHQSAARCAAE